MYTVKDFDKVYTDTVKDFDKVLHNKREQFYALHICAGISSNANPVGSFLKNGANIIITFLCKRIHNFSCLCSATGILSGNFGIWKHSFKKMSGVIAYSYCHIGMLCSIRNDVNSVSALTVANSVSFEKKVSIFEHGLPVACSLYVPC